MSRVGKQPITIPSGVQVTIADGRIVVKGPKGQLERTLNPLVVVAQNGDTLSVTVGEPEEKRQRSLWGLTQRLVANMITGVTTGYSKQLEINGVGYKAVVQGKKLVLSLGYSHPIEFPFPAGIDISVEKNLVTVSGFDNELVGETAAEIRGFRKPEPYKGKGIKYTTETIRRKAGKAAAKGA
jgi:large subunit ribosomal protein L6